MNLSGIHRLSFGTLSPVPLLFSILFCWGCSRTEEPQKQNRNDGCKTDMVESAESMQNEDSFNQTNSLVDFKAVPPRMVLRSDPALPDQTRMYLDLVSDVTAQLRWEEDRPIQIEETESEIIVVWPSRQDGTSGFHADFEARAVIDRRTLAIISLKRGG